MSKPRINYCWHCSEKLQGDHHIEKPVPKWSGDEIPRILHKSCAKSYDDEVQFGYDVESHYPEYEDQGPDEFDSYGNVFV